MNDELISKTRTLKTKLYIMKIYLKVFIFLTTFQYLIDIQMYPCNNIKGHLILYFHQNLN